jgi:hypothetical protein
VCTSLLEVNSVVSQKHIQQDTIPSYLTTLFIFVFLGPVDAIAELVDNSIQACMDEESCKISCHLFVPTGTSCQQHSYLVLLDNGKGMNINDIREFATFSRSQEIRKQSPTTGTTSGRMFIGKFGVGAKQAGFFLGDSITVLSKPKTDESRKILRFCLNEKPDVTSSTTAAAVEEFNPYQGVVEALDPSAPLLSYYVDSRMPEYFQEMHGQIQNHFQEHKHGNVIVVRLLSDITNKFQVVAAEALAKQLKDIYHFHLKQSVQYQNTAKFRLK